MSIVVHSTAQMLKVFSCLTEHITHITHLHLNYTQDQIWINWSMFQYLI